MAAIQKHAQSIRSWNERGPTQYRRERNASVHQTKKPQGPHLPAVGFHKPHVVHPGAECQEWSASRDTLCRQCPRCRSLSPETNFSRMATEEHVNRREFQCRNDTYCVVEGRCDYVAIDIAWHPAFLGQQAKKGRKVGCGAGRGVGVCVHGREDAQPFRHT